MACNEMGTFESHSPEINSILELLCGPALKRNADGPPAYRELPIRRKP